MYMHATFFCALTIQERAKEVKRVSDAGEEKLREMRGELQRQKKLMQDEVERAVKKTEDEAERREEVGNR